MLKPLRFVNFLYFLFLLESMTTDILLNKIHKCVTLPAGLWCVVGVFFRFCDWANVYALLIKLCYLYVLTAPIVEEHKIEIKKGYIPWVFTVNSHEFFHLLA